MDGTRKRVLRVLGALLYYGFATHLPDRSMPGGEFFRRIRAAVTRLFFAESEGYVNVGSHVFVADGRYIRIRDGSGIGAHSRVYGADIGRGVMIGPHVTILKQDHRFDDLETYMGKQESTPPNPPIIEDGAWIGERAIILSGRRVGRGAIVGAGAVVTRDVEPYSIVGGNPARVIGSRLSSEAEPPPIRNQDGES